LKRNLKRSKAKIRKNQKPTKPKIKIKNLKKISPLKKTRKKPKIKRKLKNSRIFQHRNYCGETNSGERNLRRLLFKDADDHGIWFSLLISLELEHANIN
jgi:hypothetical protein